MFLPHVAEVMYNLKMVIPFMYTMLSSDIPLRWVYPRLFYIFHSFSHCGAGLCLIMTLSVVYTMYYQFCV